MPSNNILINGVLSYQVSDRKMDELLEWLNQNGYDKREKDAGRVAIPCNQPQS